ncbi:hypothetical protein AAHC03_0719 [Spirometra sp. Aus1]
MSKCRYLSLHHQPVGRFTTRSPNDPSSAPTRPASQPSPPPAVSAVTVFMDYRVEQSGDCALRVLSPLPISLSEVVSRKSGPILNTGLRQLTIRSHS